MDSVTNVGGPIVWTNPNPFPSSSIPDDPDRTVPAGQFRGVAGLIVVTADICGECRIRVKEHRLEEWYFPDGTWQTAEEKDTDSGPITPTAVGGDVKSNFAVADIKNPPNPLCTKRLIMVDSPNISSELAPKPAVIRRLTVDQTVIVEDANGKEKGKMEHQFVIGYDPVAGKPIWNVKLGSVTKPK